jgi:hypothetical protein
MNLTAFIATILGVLLIVVMIAASRAPIPSTPTSSAVPSQTATSPALSAPKADDQQMSAVDPTDLVSNAAFQAKYPGYVEAVHKLIVASGHPCETMLALWTKGDSPDGTRLEAQCGAESRDATERYAVYPQRQKVIACEDTVENHCE